MDYWFVLIFIFFCKIEMQKDFAGAIFVHQPSQCGSWIWEDDG